MDRLSSIRGHLLPVPCAAPVKNVVRVAVTGAAGQISYSLLLEIGAGRMFGSDQPVILQLLEVPVAEKALSGVVMELQDCALPLVEGIIATTDPAVAFKDADVAIFVGAFPRKQGMERKDLLEKNAEIFHSQGAILAKTASPNVKVLVVGNPANTNCLLLRNAAGNAIPSENFTCLTRLDQNRAKAQLAQKLSVPVKSISNVVIWGNHSLTQYPFIGKAVVNDPKTNTKSPVSVDAEWFKSYFIPTVQKRGGAIIEARKLSSAASAANAIVDHIRDWWLGSAGEIVSMGVVSDGSYGIPKGLIFSYPVVCNPGGSYTIIQGIQLDEFSQERIKVTTQELIEERDTALAFVNKN